MTIPLALFREPRSFAFFLRSFSLSCHGRPANTQSAARRGLPIALFRDEAKRDELPEPRRGEHERPGAPFHVPPRGIHGASRMGSFRRRGRFRRDSTRSRISRRVGRANWLRFFPRAPKTFHPGLITPADANWLRFSRRAGGSRPTGRIRFVFSRGEFPTVSGWLKTRSRAAKAGRGTAHRCRSRRPARGSPSDRPGLGVSQGCTCASSQCGSIRLG